MAAAAAHEVPLRLADVHNSHAKMEWLLLRAEGYHPAASNVVGGAAPVPRYFAAEAGSLAVARHLN